MQVATNIQLRRDTANNWTINNPVLLQGEIGIELDTKRLKIGDGINKWAALQYNDAITPIEQSLINDNLDIRDILEQLVKELTVQGFPFQSEKLINLLT